MTMGIYKLSFNDTSKVYIGQSKNIERRYTIHLRLLELGQAAKKLQEAYRLYGKPSLEILCESPESDLDKDELEAISIFDSVNNGFNTLMHIAGKNSNIGEKANRSFYKDIQYIEILHLLAENRLSRKQIADTVGTSVDVVKSIAVLECHKWLKDQFPAEYAILESQQRNYSASDNGKISAVIKEPLRIKSPEGVVYDVYSIRGFSRKHNLTPQNVGSLLRGQTDSYKGWTRPDTEINRYYPTILSPDGLEFNIKYGEAASFAKEHDLNAGMLSRLLNKRVSEYKKWSLKQI